MEFDDSDHSGSISERDEDSEQDEAAAQARVAQRTTRTSTGTARSFGDWSRITNMHAQSVGDPLSASLPRQQIRPSSSHSASASFDSSFRLHWVESERMSRSVASVRFSPSGTLLAVVGADAVVRVYDSKLGTLVNELHGHTMGINDVAWKSDSGHIATASDDRSVMIWGVGNASMESAGASSGPTKSTVGVRLAVLQQHKGPVVGVAFNNPLGNLLAACSFDETITIWSVSSWKIVRQIDGHAGPVVSLDFSPDGSQIVSGSFDGLARVWRVHTGQCLRSLCCTSERTDSTDSREDDLEGVRRSAKAGRPPPVTCVKFAPNAKLILTSSLDGYIRIWDVKANKILKSYHGHPNSRYACFCTFLTTPTDAMYVVSGAEDGFVYVWHLQSRVIVQKLPCGIVAHDKRVAASTLTESGAALRGNGRGTPVLAVDCHPSENMIAVGSHDPYPSVQVWWWDSMAAKVRQIHRHSPTEGEVQASATEG